MAGGCSRRGPPPAPAPPRASGPGCSRTGDIRREDHCANSRAASTSSTRSGWRSARASRPAFHARRTGASTRAICTPATTRGRAERGRG
eukprot:8676596-Alexandrium_andersonii.AAC.1